MAKRNDVTQQEREAMKQSEADMDLTGTSQAVDEEQVEATLTESGADADAVMSAEAAAVHTDTETAEAANTAVDTPTKQRRKPAPSQKKTKAKKQRSAKYQAAAAKLTVTGPLPLKQAIEAVQATSYTKFDGTVELHVRLAPKKKESSDGLRGLVQLPNGTPRQVNAIVLTEALIDEIATTKRADADLYLASPALMAKVAKVARILGPQGKMPNPKTGTVTDDPDAAIRAIQSGRVEYRADASGIVHVGVAKVSWEMDRIAENVQTVLQAIGVHRLRSVALTSTMGPGIAVDLTTIGA